MPSLTITADDFGLCSEVNEAVRRAHVEGVLTSASLMVAESAASEAIQIAKKNPTLKVGLHLTLIEGKSVLPHAEIPDLIDRDGNFSNDIVRSGIRYFFLKKMRHQIEKECEAQVVKFLESGIPIDHINSHNHLHIHPTLADIVIRIAKRFAIPWMRLPQMSPRGERVVLSIMSPFVKMLRRKLDRQNMRHNDFVFGLRETGKMTPENWHRILEKIPAGFIEIYTHPATHTSSILKKTMPKYLHAEELAALVDPQIKQRLLQKGFQLSTESKSRP